MKKFYVFLICLIVPAFFVACANSNKQTLATPSIVVIKGGTIVFNPVADAEYYTISINDTEISLNVNHSNFVEIVDNQINYDASKIFVVGDSYSVKIRANAEKKVSSEFSQAFSYKHNGSIKKPTNIKINATTLTWDVVENADYYIVKIITPNDNIILDKNGNVLSQDDSESIAKADLTEYAFNTNNFDFSSLLTTAGTYKFYVCSVINDDTTYVESSYSSKVIYSHQVTLSTPANGQVYKVNGDLHLLTAFDFNANAISISCDSLEKTTEINSSDQSITIINDNLIDVNLNQYFESFIAASKLNLDEIKQFSFTTQSIYLSNIVENSFYVNSNVSDSIIFENTHKLTAPTISLEYSQANQSYIATWKTNEMNYVGQFKLLVATSSELKEYTLDANITSLLLTDDFVAVAVQAVGYGNYLSSNLSDFVANPEITNNLSTISCNLSNNILTWNPTQDAFYIVELNGKYTVLSESSFTIPSDEITSNDYSIKITAIKENHKPTTKVVNLEYTAKLATPTIGYSQGFNSSKLYELTFSGVNNAFGYYIYIKSKTTTEFSQINTLYTSTTIDLSKYICSAGEYTDYEVKIQAVADIHSIYSNSDLSTSVSVSHIKVLESPEFYKLNDTTIPVSKQTTGGATKYILKFYGIENAGSYEILINYNKLTVPIKSVDYVGLYEVDISAYMVAANNYEIKVRAIPSDSSFNVKESEYSVANYALTKQLSMVENIQVNENDGIYTLSFDPIDNAEAYRIRIVKENDSSYLEYLNNLGLSNNFVVTQSTDVTEYVKQQGVYYFYVTALAPTENSYYADASESTTYGEVSKLTTLNSPKNIEFVNSSKDSYLLNWTGDENADYYLVKITDPNNISYTFKVYSSTSTNINKYITIQGTYNVSIYSMVNAVGTNSKEYSSSPATTSTTHYTYKTEKDFLRYSIYMYGESYDFAVDNIDDLKNLLWYHYLYEMNSNGLSILINPQLNDDKTYTSTLREAIINLATNAHNSHTYYFNEDEQWLALTGESTKTDNELFSYLCKKLLAVYPEFNVLQSFSLSHTSGSYMFNLTYSNALNVEKTDGPSTMFANTNYGNDYSYIDLSSRKSSTGVFKIDAREEMLVTTTEQLLQAVQHNRKPKFVGDCHVAETVYNNAKLVLSAIVTNNMSDLEKVTTIFDWLEYGFDLSYYYIDGANYISGSVEISDVSTYGLYSQYYLEGIFENITMLNNGNIQIENNLATSQSYSKAFALLCAIEGIDATVINGTYEYYDTHTKTTATANHVWNKVYIDVDQSGKNWYVVDLTFSDNRVNFNYLDNGYGISSHTYFLTRDSLSELNLNVKDESYIISSEYETSRNCETNYNFYENTSFGLTYNQISNTILDFESDTITCSDFVYSKEFNPDESYQKYAKTTGYGELQSFLLNSMIYAEYMADLNSSNKCVFEFKFNWKNNGGSNIFDITQLKSIFDTAPSYYNLKLKLVTDVGGNVYSVEDSEKSTTTIIYIVEKTA